MMLTLRQLIDNYDNDQGLLYWSFYEDNPILPWNVARMRKEEWYDPERSFARLQRYLIPDELFEIKWRDVYNRVFTDRTLEGIIRNPLSGFQEGIHGKGFVGGHIFQKETYECLQQCLLSIGEDEIIITGGVEGWPILHLRLPVRFSWEDICHEGYALMSILNTEDGVFKVFGSRCCWGKICVNEANLLNGVPFFDYCFLDVIGFKDFGLLEKYESLLPEDLTDPDAPDAPLI